MTDYYRAPGSDNNFSKQDDVAAEYARQREEGILPPKDLELQLSFGQIMRGAFLEPDQVEKEVPNPDDVEVICRRIADDFCKQLHHAEGLLRTYQPSYGWDGEAQGFLLHCLNNPALAPMNILELPCNESDKDELTLESLYNFISEKLVSITMLEKKSIYKMKDCIRKLRRILRDIS